MKTNYPYFARYAVQRDQSQLLCKHLHETAEMMSGFLEVLGLSRLGTMTGLLHDLGKYNASFQQYLADVCDATYSPWYHKGAGKHRIDHSTCGAKLAEQLRVRSDKRWLWDVLELCIAGHHAGLEDMLNAQGDPVFYNQRLANQRTFELPHLCDIPDENIANSLKQITIEKKDVNDAFERFMFLKMTFSCLVDADRASAAGEGILKDKVPNWQELISRLEAKLATFTADTDVNAERMHLSNESLKAADAPMGVFSMAVPTGGGKTLASLRFALAHTKKHNLKRIIYIVPYTSIVDQNADETRKILEQGKDKWSVVLEHHANLIISESDEERYSQLTDRWDCPVIYTTMVQFLNAVFSDKSRSARRAHQLMDSVIIFDEIQALPINMVYLFNNAANFLLKHGRSSIVLCSATQPLFHKVKEEQHALLPPIPIIHDPSLLQQKLTRTDVIYCPESNHATTEQLISFILQQEVPSTLVIANTKKHAKEIFTALPDSADKYHLTTDLCPAHRREIIRDIKTRLLTTGERPLVVIATQLIECGVDVDFHCVIRMMAGLDSIAQAAGRCNRHGHRAIEKVFVWHNPDHITLPDSIQNTVTIACRIFDEHQKELNKSENLLDPYWMDRYYLYYYLSDSQAKKMSYPMEEGGNLLDWLTTNQAAKEEFKRTHQQNGRLTSEPPGLIGRYKQVGDNFDAIEDHGSAGILVRWSDSDTLIEQMRKTYAPSELKRLLRQAQQYTVAVYPQRLQQLIAKDAVRLIRKDLPVFVLEALYGDKPLYDEQLGLNDVIELPETLMF